MTFEEWARSRGYAQRENGDWVVADDDSGGPIDPGQLEQDYARSFLFGQAGGPVDPGVRDGVQYAQIGGWANNDPNDQQRALQLEIDHLKQFGIEPIYDNQYGWIVPDDAKLARAHPAQSPNGFDQFLAAAFPALVGGGMLAGIGAGLAGLGGTTGALSDAAIADSLAESGVTATDIAETMAAEDLAAGTTAAQGAAEAGINISNPGVLQTIQDLGIPVTNPMVQTVAKQAAGGAIQSGLRGGDPLEGAVMGGALGGLSSGIGSLTSGLTPYPVVNQMAGSGALSGIVAGATGRDPVEGALSGATSAGIGNVVGGLTNNLTGSPLADKAIGNAGASAIYSGIMGGDPAQAALSGALNTGTKAVTGALWNAAKGIWEDPYTHTPAELQGPTQSGGALAEAPQTLPESYWTQTAQADTGTLTDVPANVAPEPTSIDIVGGGLGPHVKYEKLQDAIDRYGSSSGIRYPFTGFRVDQAGNILATDTYDGSESIIGTLADKMPPIDDRAIEAEAQRQFQVQVQIEAELLRQQEAARAQAEAQARAQAEAARVAGERVTAQAAAARVEAERQAAEARTAAERVAAEATQRRADEQAAAAEQARVAAQQEAARVAEAQRQAEAQAQAEATARAQAEGVAGGAGTTPGIVPGEAGGIPGGTGSPTPTAQPAAIPTSLPATSAGSSNGIEGALPAIVASGALGLTAGNSEDTNMAESNWWDELTSEFGNAGEVAMKNTDSGLTWDEQQALWAEQAENGTLRAYPTDGGALNEVDQWLNDIGATRNTDGSINWESVDNTDTLQSLGTIDEGPGALDFSSAADSLGLQQMGEAAGLKGDALAKFVASGGTQGSTRAGGGGIGTGAGIPFGASGGAGGSATNANTININNGGALGNLPSWALPALVAGLALDNPDRTSTTKVEYPDWYNTGAKSALAQADKFGALGPDSIAPLSGNENEAIQMAKDSSGMWVPQLDKAASTLDESKYFYNKAGALNDAVPGFVNAASGRADAAMPYFGTAGALAGSVPDYLDRAGGQVNAAMPYFGKAGETADTVGGYLNRATGQVDASMPYFGKAAGQVGEAMPYFGKAGDMADSVSGYLNKSGALADQAAGGIPSVNLSAYMNPYLDNVLAPIARRNELAKAAALNDIKAKAGMRGAFGGSRSTLLESEIAESADRNLNEAEANIRSGAFNTALTTAQADLNRILQASGQYGNIAGTAGNTAGIYGGIGKTVADTGNIYSGVGKNIADTAGTFTTAGNVAGNTANVYGGIGKGIADTAGVFNNSGVVATGAANSLTGAGKGIADTADIFNKSAGALTGAANADTNIGRSLTDASSGYRANAGVFGQLTDADIARLMGTGATGRSVEQAKRNAPLTAIGGYAAALRGAGTPGATTTNVAPEASKIGQAATGLGALIGANKAGLI